MRTRSYVIVTMPEHGAPARPAGAGAGRHRLGRPGGVRRHARGKRTGPPRRAFCRGRHRRVEKPSVVAARYSTLVMLVGTVTVSGWFAATGAAAFAQMIQP